MSCTWKVDVGEGREWCVGSLFSLTTGEVIIPLDQIEGMSDAEIGAAVRSLVYQADLGVALVFADHIIANKGVNEYAQDFMHQVNTLGRHLGTYESIDRAYHMAVDAAIKSQRKQERTDRKYINEPVRAGYIYVIRSGPYFKIGRTNRIDRRMAQLGVQMPHPVEIVWTKHVTDMCTAERYLHERFAGKRLNGEWFDLDSNDLHAILEEYKD